MKLVLSRNKKTSLAMIGSLSVDGAFECYTLEDPDGAGDRIDAGTYNVITDFSNRFQKQMPLLTGPKVDGRGIRIHCGNTQADTEGCILLGQSEGENEVEGSRLAFDSFYPKLAAALRNGEVVSLTVLDQTAPIDDPARCRVSPSPSRLPDNAPSPQQPILGMVLSFLMSMWTKR